MEQLTVGSVFSGIGGLEKGFADLGCEIVFQIEIDAQCRTILHRHWPDAVQYTDVTEVTYERLRADLGDRADVDVLVGGWPCQDISLAGRRRGLVGARSGLFFEFARLVSEIAPVWIVAENVPGLISSYSPVDPPPDPAFQREWRVEETSDLGVVCSTLGELGYGYAGRVLDAQHFGVPQRRRRVLFVGHLGKPWSASPEILFEPDSRVGDPAESAEAWEDDAASVADSLGTDGEPTPDTGRYTGSERQRAGEIVSSLTASDGGVDFDMAEAGHLIPQAFGVTEPGVSGPLGAGDHGHRQDFDSAGAYVVGDHWRNDRARTLTSPKQGHHYDLDTENFVVESDPVAFRKARRSHDPDDPETWVEDEVVNTLNGFDVGDQRATTAIVEAIPVELRMATRTSGAVGAGTPGVGFGDPGDPSYPVMASPPPAMQHDLIVRRLTPIECERLQGFPDGWTEGHADTVRYKQLGNAVAVPCSRWVAGRLIGQHRKLDS